MVGRVFLGRYEALRLLGEGGMGVVYLARQLDLGRQVVVKVMHDKVAADPKFKERFLRETLLMARFQHPYAVTLYDASLDDPHGPCIIMEYIRGLTLDTLVKNNGGRLNPVRMGRVLGQLCEVLQAAHHVGIVHRDLKPGNLMIVDPDTPYEKIKVMDFGLAKLVGQSTLQDATESSAEFVVGTPGYMCPEQARGEETDHRADLYSVGIILYEVLSGRLPFANRASMELLMAHATESPPALADIGADWVTPAVEEVIQVCLAKDPAERPASARDLAERYQKALEEETPPRRQPAPPPQPPVTEPPPRAGGNRAVHPEAVVHNLEAWMPEAIAAYKLRGFLQEAGGEVLESLPGLIRVRLGGPNSRYRFRSGPLSWLGMGRNSGLTELQLHMQPAGAERQGKLRITVEMRSLSGMSVLDPIWRLRCNQIYCDLRAYLMGQTEAADDRALSAQHGQG